MHPRVVAVRTDIKTLTGHTDKAGHVTLSDVLGTRKHQIHVFADPSHRTPVNVSGVRVYDNGREISVSRVKTNVFSIELGTQAENHVTFKITSNRRSAPVYTSVWQYRVIQNRARPQPQRQLYHSGPNGEACLCDECSAACQRTAGYQAMASRKDDDCIIV